MNKYFILFLSITIVPTMSAMEQEPLSELRHKLHQTVSRALLAETAETFEDILDRLTELGENPLFSNLVHNEALYTYLAKEYIAQHQETISTEFLHAVVYNKKHVVQALLSAGMDVNTYDESGYTGLMLATVNGHTEIMKILIKVGANVNIVGNGPTVLFKASQNGYTEIVKMLIEAGADVNIHGLYPPPITYAAINGHQKIVKMLIKAGAYVNITDELGGIPILDLVRKKGYYKIARILRRNAIT